MTAEVLSIGREGSGSAASMAVRVVGRKQEADGIVSLQLAHLDGCELPPFTAGAHIDVTAAPGLVRQYSLCGRTCDRQSYRIGVLLDPTSRGGSQAIHALREGDVITISTPANRFPLVSRSTPALLFAGGIGITPLLAMARSLSKAGCPFKLHYSVRCRSKAAFMGEIADSRFADSVRMHFDDEPGTHLDIGGELAAAAANSDIYVCGPAGYIEWVIEAATAVGFPGSRIHREYFSSPGAPGALTDDRFEIKLASSEAVYVVEPGETILDVLRRSGVSVPASCEQGVCGTCLTRVIAGVPDHRDLILTEEERQEWVALCCSRAHSQTLVLDL